MSRSREFTHFQGFKVDGRRSERWVNEVNPLNHHIFDSYKLDEIQVTATLTSVKAVDRMIEILQVARYCLMGARSTGLPVADTSSEDLPQIRIVKSTP